MSHANQSYSKLIERVREAEVLRSVGSVLQWDEEVQMPPKGANLRAQQSGVIARLAHERFTDPAIGELLTEVDGSELVRNPESDAGANVRELRRTYDRATKLPSSLVEEMTRTQVMAHHAWVDARKKSQYSDFEPWLGKTLDLKRQEATCYLNGKSGNFYGALLESYEPGESVDDLNRVFESLRGPLVELVGKIVESGRKAPLKIMERKYPAEKQAKLAREAAQRVGFDFQAGRLDISVHPFCSGIGPGDCRLTTRYDENFFGDAFFGVLHEAGHGLYEQGLPKEEHFGSPLGEAVSLGIHESQSRMWENFVGRGRPFWRFFFPKVQEEFPEALRDVSEEQWVFAANDVRPSLIRTEADEATYNLHVLLRFEIEQAMLAGDLKTGEIPGAWNEKMKKYLGLTPPDDARGCLQDVHWSHGSLGYFPTYTLGNLYAAQFYEQARKDVAGLEGQFERGEFSGLLNWLRDKIHRHGQRYRARDLVKRVTGKELSAEPLLNHLRGKAAEFYHV